MAMTISIYFCLDLFLNKERVKEARLPVQSNPVDPHPKVSFSFLLYLDNGRTMHFKDQGNYEMESPIKR